MESLPTGKIREIVVLNKFDGFRITVGQTFKPKGVTLEVTDIVRDENSAALHGVLRYIVYVKEKGGEPFAWKYYENIALEVTCEIPND